MKINSTVGVVPVVQNINFIYDKRIEQQHDYNGTPFPKNHKFVTKNTYVYVPFSVEDSMFVSDKCDLFFVVGVKKARYDKDDKASARFFAITKFNSFAELLFNAQIKDIRKAMIDSWVKNGLVQLLTFEEISKLKAVAFQARQRENLLIQFKREFYTI
jgi:hypothetical protein